MLVPGPVLLQLCTCYAPAGSVGKPSRLLLQGQLLHMGGGQLRVRAFASDPLHYRTWPRRATRGFLIVPASSLKETWLPALYLSEESPLDQHTFSSLRLYIIVKTNTGAPSVVLTPLPPQEVLVSLLFPRNENRDPVGCFYPPPPHNRPCKTLNSCPCCFHKLTCFSNHPGPASVTLSVCQQPYQKGYNQVSRGSQS